MTALDFDLIDFVGSDPIKNEEISTIKSRICPSPGLGDALWWTRSGAAPQFVYMEHRHKPPLLCPPSIIGSNHIPVQSNSKVASAEIVAWGDEYIDSIF
jgi:hypothetical protein